MADTITRYLKLKISSDLSADAKANLEKIDALGRVFSTNASSSALIQAIEDITIEPASPSIGGTGQNSGILNLGSVDNKPTIIAYSSEFRLRSALKLPAGNTYYVAVGVAETTADKTLTIDVNDSNRTITFSHDGEVVTEDAAQILTNKTVSGTFSGPLTGNVTGNVTGNLTGNVTGNVTGDVTGNADTATDLATGSILSVAKGGTGNNGSNKAAALLDLLPTISGQAAATLRVNNTEDGLEWAIGAGEGSVKSISMIVPDEFNINPTGPITVEGTFTVSKKSQSPNIIYASPNGTSGVPTFRSLVEADIPSLAQSKITNLVSDLSGKQATITGAASTITTSNLTVSRALQSDGNGKVEVSSVTATELGYLSGVTSALQTQLNGKEPTITAGTTSQYWRGDKTWYSPVIDSTAGSETDQAASVAAMKSYVGSYSGGSYAADWTSGTSITLTHGLNSEDITINIYDKDTKREILVDEINRGDTTLPTPLDTTTKVTLTASQAPTGSGWRVVVRK